MKKTKGNQYGFITHQWDPLMGDCLHNCSYCSIDTSKARFPTVNAYYSGEPRLNEKELNCNLGSGNFIFVCSNRDLFAENVPWELIESIFVKIRFCRPNKFLIQTKNTKRLFEFIEATGSFDNEYYCTTIESDVYWAPLMGNTLDPFERYKYFNDLGVRNKMLTIEPIIDFDYELLSWIKDINPMQINIGADSKGHHLPEPSPEKLGRFIDALKAAGFNLYLKKNLNRLLT